MPTSTGINQATIDLPKNLHTHYFQYERSRPQSVHAQQETGRNDKTGEEGKVPTGTHYINTKGADLIPSAFTKKHERSRPLSVHVQHETGKERQEGEGPLRD